MNRVVEEYRQAMRDVGLEPPFEIIADGDLHRFHVVGDRFGTRNGWYVIHGDAFPAGQFGCWKRGISKIWSRKQLPQMEAHEREAFLAKVADMKTKHDEEIERVRAACRARSTVIWNAARPAKSSHGYLVAKRVQPYGIKWSRGALIVPVRDVKGSLCGLQKIWRQGSGGKRFEVGTAITGNFFTIGRLEAETLVICEGYATGASIHVATGLDVVVAFDAGNLKPVAEMLRLTYPHIHLVIAADNDQWTVGNPGVEKAAAAAEAVGGVLIIPVFGNLGHGLTDFNDLACAEGNGVVRGIFERQGVRCV